MCVFCDEILKDFEARLTRRFSTTRKWTATLPSLSAKLHSKICHFNMKTIALNHAFFLQYRRIKNGKHVRFSCELSLQVKNIELPVFGPFFTDYLHLDLWKTLFSIVL